ncbi:siderophore-interacting protein [Microbacterium sp. SS28]|uniref:siderophore-interacting protein n=1 Tax=Microbacterium sp. SS28 TaxID=2919948 RepID=UPI001FAB0CD3|nr:siderophore-interacting protein [Microbacterium sp. SS28]
MTDAAAQPPRPLAGRAEDDPASRFFRGGGRHRFTAREAFVTAVSQPVAEFVRVTLSGPDFHDFASTGPSDHVRVFFPDPATGELVAPRPATEGEDGIVRPDAPMLARDFTPLNPRVDEATGYGAFDLDFLLHADPGPAAAFGAQAKLGDRLVVVGPRGSKNATQNAPRILLVVDPTAFPAASRWAAEVPASTRVDVIVDVAGDLAWAETYLRATRDDVTVTAGGADLADAVRTAGVDAGTFVFGAGEASRLIPLRRLLRYELELPRAQFALSGYWKRGAAAFDHHAPIDPADPD